MSEKATIKRRKLTPLNVLSFAFGNQAKKRQFVVCGGDARQSCYWFLFRGIDMD
jgi:hypothetical protein